jgi:large subunit ribosomal protein L23
MNIHQVIKRPLHTEKSVADMQENNTYHFEVDPHATKTDVKRAVQELFDQVEVQSVRTARIPGKERRVRWTTGKTKDRKKAMVRLRPGDTIDLGY